MCSSSVFVSALKFSLEIVFPRYVELDTSRNEFCLICTYDFVLHFLLMVIKLFYHSFNQHSLVKDF